MFDVLASAVVVSVIVTVWLGVEAYFQNRARKAAVAAGAPEPAWIGVYEKYRGYLFKAVKTAEKLIPDNAENKAVRRADEALKLAKRYIEEYEQRKLSGEEAAALAQAVEIAHTEAVDVRG